MTNTTNTTNTHRDHVFLRLPPSLAAITCAMAASRVLLRAQRLLIALQAVIALADIALVCFTFVFFLRVSVFLMLLCVRSVLIDVCACVCVQPVSVHPFVPLASSAAKTPTANRIIVLIRNVHLA